MKTVATSGYYIWLHAGHIESFRLAKQLGDKLIVILNNDTQQVRKYGKIIVPFNERKKILEAIKHIDYVIESRDKDSSVCKTLEILKPNIFAKGGDRFVKEIPEKDICEKLLIQMVDGLGNKIQSSSDLLKKWRK
jgi:cytidyltransferase-like protein